MRRVWDATGAWAAKVCWVSIKPKVTEIGERRRFKPGYREVIMADGGPLVKR